MEHKLSQFKYLQQIIAIVIAYIVLGKLGLTFAVSHGNVTIIWPPTGLALAVLVVGGYRYWPGVFFGAFGLNALTDIHLATAFSIAIGNTMEAYAGTYLLRRFNFSTKMDHQKDIWWLLIFGVIFCTLLGSAWGSVALLVANEITREQLLTVASDWWMGDALGALVFFPFLLILFQKSTRDDLKAHAAYIVPVSLAIAFSTLINFNSYISFSGFGNILLFLPFPFVFWLSIKHGVNGGVIGTLVFVCVAVLGSAQGYGIFMANVTVHQGLIGLAGYVVSGSVISLLTAAALTESLNTQMALKKSEDRLRRSHLYANIGSWDWNIKTGALFWSERIAPLFGYPEGDLETSYENFIQAVHPEDRHLVQDAVRDCLENGVEYSIEHRCVWPDGTIRWLQENGDVDRDEHGQPSHMLGVVQDITARKEAQELLSKAKQEAELVSEYKSKFLTNMSHELRTPLNAIIGYSELVQEELLDAGVTMCQEDLKKIRQAGGYLLGLVNDLLDLSKIESGSMQVTCQEFPVRQIVQHIIDTAQPIAMRNNNTLSCYFADEIDMMFSDQIKLKQILINIVGNACKFTNKGQVALKVELRGSDIVFVVKDTGPGLTSEQKATIFDQYVQIQNHVHAGLQGSGLGLTIVKRLIALLGGEVVVESEPGKGTEFMVVLPVRVCGV